MSVIWDESDLDWGSRRDDGRRGDVAAVSTQNVSGFWGPIADLYEVIPEQNKTKQNEEGRNGFY